MVVDVLNACDPKSYDAWLAIWERSLYADVFSHPAYCDLLASDGAAAVAVHGTFPAGEVLFPLILRDVGREVWCNHVSDWAVVDAVTPYGYGGPVWWGDDREETARQFWPVYEEWAHDLGMVCEFVRFHLFPGMLLPYPGTTRVDRENVVWDLTPSPDELWSTAKHKVRKNVNRARRESLEVVFQPGGARLDEFLALYDSTMERRRAALRYRWQRPFFEGIIANLPANHMFAHVLKQGRVISSELVLLSRNVMYSYLGGTDAAFYESRPNDLLKWEAAIWGRDHGMRYYVLGGGYEPDDGIYRYKASFAPHGSRPFLVGHDIHDEVGYHQLVAQRVRCATLAGHTWAPDPGFFPAYRA